MKKIIKIILLLVIVVLSGCDNVHTIVSNETPESTALLTDTGIDTPATSKCPTDTTISAENNIRYIDHMEEFIYGDTVELFNDSTNIFEGQVVNISFVIKEDTIYPTEKKPENGGLALYTIYEIKPTKVYKGEEKEVYYFEIWGGLRYVNGIKDFRLEEQISLLKDHGLNEFHTLNNGDHRPIDPEIPYLFMLKEGSDGVLRYGSHEEFFSIIDSNYCHHPYYNEEIRYFVDYYYPTVHPDLEYRFEEEYPLETDPMKLFEAADYMIDAEITGISFQINSDTEYKLETVYEITPNFFYKGEGAEKYYVHVPCGHPGYQVDVQRKLLGKSFTDTYQLSTDIPIAVNICRFNIGDRIKFLLKGENSSSCEPVHLFQYSYDDSEPLNPITRKFNYGVKFLSECPTANDIVKAWNEIRNK